MTDFKQMMKETYGKAVEIDDLRLRKMHNSIMGRIEKVDEKRQQKTWFQFAKVAAVFAIVFISYDLLQQTQSFIDDNQLFAKIDVVAEQAVEQKEDISKTIISYQTQEDMYLQMMNQRLAKLQDSEKERFLQEIF